MKNSKFKTFRRVLRLILLVALAALLAAMPLLARSGVQTEEHPLSILSAQAENRTVAIGLAGGGALTGREAISLTVPQNVKLTEFLVENGDTVAPGDPIAKVDRVTVMEALADAQEKIEALTQELEEARKESPDVELSAPRGTVKQVFAQPGDDAAQVMLEHGALAVVSLDDKMALELAVQTPHLAGDLLQVQIGEADYPGTVESNLDGVLKIVLADEGLPVGAQATVLDAQGTVLGHALLAVHKPWNAAAYSGTVKAVKVTQGQTLWNGGTILTIQGDAFSPKCRSLSASIREYQERMLELFRLYQNLTLTAPEGGTVTGVDAHSAQLLRAEAGWEVTLLANAPNGEDDVDYVNFVGRLTEIALDGWLLKLNPQPLVIEDYMDLSAVPTDPAAMTETVHYEGNAPVFQLAQGQWELTEARAGDTLLFAGDDQQNILWAIRMGGQEPEPTEPTDPTEPSEPTDPSEPPEPTEPTMPSIPDFTLPDYTIPDYTMPDLGGYTGQLPGGYAQPQQPDPGLTDVQVAAITPGAVLELPITIDEQDIHRLETGMAVTVTLEALRGRSYSGTITEIAHIGTNLGGSTKFTVTVTLPWETDMLPGMNASVTIPLSQETGIAIPVAAVQTQEGKTLVYTALNPETGEPASPMEITTGVSDGEYVLVEGLAPGTTVYYGYYEAN